MIIKKILASPMKLFAVALLVFIALPIGVQAATDSDDTIVEVSIGSVISIATTGTVDLAITPVAGGAQTSDSGTVTVSTNNAAGYTLTIENDSANTSLLNGAETITAHAGTVASPTALANNTWGFAVAGGNFDGSYSALNNVASSTTLWAGVPASGSPVTIKTTASTATDDETVVWFSAKADTTKPDGTYASTVTFTAATID